MVQAKLRWSCVGCSAPYSESVMARLAARGVLVDDPGDGSEGRPLVVILCDSPERWDQLASFAARAGTIVVAVLPQLDIEGYTRSLSVGADGVVYVDTSSTITADVIVAASQGEVLLPKQAAQAIARLAHRERPATELDAVDLVLLRSLSDGTTVAEIASRLHYSERTVRRYLQNLYLRLGVRNRAEAIAVGGKSGLLDD